VPALSQTPSQAPSPTPSQTPSIAVPPPNPDAVHNELRAFRDGLLAAMNKSDIEAELLYFHPNAVVTWHNAEVSRGREGIRSYLNRMLQGPNKVVASYKADVNVDELTILYGGNTGGSKTGLSFGSAVEHFTLTSGKSLDLPARWSATLVKEGDKWLIANLHASDNLFDNPLLTLAKRTATWAGGIALLVGLLIGWFLGGRRGRA
jgi:ketosteroid isomerase-like protein